MLSLTKQTSNDLKLRLCIFKFALEMNFTDHILNSDNMEIATNKTHHMVLLSYPNDPTKTVKNRSEARNNPPPVGPKPTKKEDSDQA